MEIEAEGDLQITTNIPFLINLGQVTVVPASIKWPSESSHQKQKQQPSITLCGTMLDASEGRQFQHQELGPSIWAQDPWKGNQNLFLL